MTSGVRQAARKPALVMAVLIAIALAVVGCGGGGSGSTGGGGGATTGGTGQTREGGSISVALAGGEVETLDPTNALSNQSITVVLQIMDTLYKLNSNSEVVPWLVTSADKSKNAEHWVFHLRKGVKFSTGKPMTAEDAAFSLEVARKSANYSTLFEPFKTIKATSPTTLEITTSQPLPSMEAILTSWVTAVVPNNFGGVSEKQFGEHPIGTGPFELASWKHGTSVLLDRNPDYWGKTPPLEEVKFVAAPEDNSRLSQLKGGDLDMIETPPLAQVETIEHSPGLNVVTSNPLYAQYIVVNAREKKFQDPRIREAINLAVDRESINQTAMGGHGELGASFLVPSLPYHNAGLQPPAQNLAKAKKLVSEAVADGGEPTFTLLYAAGETRYSLSAQIIQSNLEEVGFKVSLQPLDSSALLTKASEGDYEIALEALSAGIPDPSENVALYLATESFFTGAENAKVTKLAEEGTKEIDTQKRQQIYYELQEEVAKENFLMNLAYEPVFWAESDELLGLKPNSIGIVWYSELGLAK